MTPEQQDILGIVKELQEEHDGLTYLHVVEETGSDRAEICFHAQDAIHIVKLHHHFPAIAKALLIAVEALNDSIQCHTEFYEEADPTLCNCQQCENSRIALSRILK